MATGKMEDAAKTGEQGKKKSFGTKFMNFLAYGGFLVLLIGGFALYILIAWLFK
jgi:prepilin signal peptidase PulO-like enzyme (type II secretory pathway)